jgi:hypothetical protein
MKMSPSGPHGLPTGDEGGRLLFLSRSFSRPHEIGTIRLILHGWEQEKEGIGSKQQPLMQRLRKTTSFYYFFPVLPSLLSFLDFLCQVRPRVSSRITNRLNPVSYVADEVLVDSIQSNIMTHSNISPLARHERVDATIIRRTQQHTKNTY